MSDRQTRAKTSLLATTSRSGSEMSRVREALHWDGFNPRVSLFLVSGSDAEIDFSQAWKDRPQQVKLYRLVDDPDPGRIRTVHEYDSISISTRCR
ncbi:MAG: hypothetical protein ABIQ18_25820 [Umezawaea sp.]